jgi:hypothetical protein
MVAVKRGPGSGGGDGQGATFFVAHVSGHADELGLIDDEVFCVHEDQSGGGCQMENKMRRTLSDTVDSAADSSHHGVHLDVFILHSKA